MKKLIIILAVLPLLAMGQVSLIWNNYPGGVSISTDAFDHVYTVWWEYNPAGDIYLDKRDENGNLLWEVKYENTDNTRHEVATWVACDNNNDIIVSGTIRSGYASPVNAASVLMKFNPDGDLLWRVVYESSFDGSSTKKILIDAENNIYVLGMSPTLTKVKKFDTNGNSLWNYTNTSGIGAALNFKFSQDGNIVISGRGIYGSINGYAKIDPDGNELFSAIGIYSLTVGDIAGDAAGNSYIINGVYGFGTEGSVIRKLDPMGNIVWVDTNSITATKVEVGADQNPVVGGFPNTGTFGVSMIKYDGAGNTIWENHDADGPAYTLMMHAGMQIDPANNVYFAAGTLFEMAVCRVNANGSYNYTATSPGSYSYWFDFSADYSSLFVTGGQVARFDQGAIELCEPPGGLFANNITTTKARVNWTLEPGAVQYEVWYKKTAAGGWKKKFVPGISNKLNIKNLTCNTNYVWKIRTVCDTVGVDFKSDFSADQFFTTSACRDEYVAMEENISIFPNPASDLIMITADNQTFHQLDLFDLNGKLILHLGEIGVTGCSMDIGNVPVGSYVLRIQTDSGIINHQIIISR